MLVQGDSTSSHEIVICVCVCARAVCTLYQWKPEIALDFFEFELWTFVSYSVGAGHQELSWATSIAPATELSKTDFLNWPALLPGNSWCSFTTMQCEVFLWSSELIL